MKQKVKRLAVEIAEGFMIGFASGAGLYLAVTICLKIF